MQPCEDYFVSHNQHYHQIPQCLQYSFTHQRVSLQESYIMARFRDIPQELLCAIIASCQDQHRHALVSSPYLPGIGLAYKILNDRRVSTKSLLSLSLTSKELNRLTEPYLYESWGTTGNDCESWTRVKLRSLQRFLLAILSRPHLASYVRYVEANCWTELGIQQVHFISSQSADIQLLTQAARKVAVPDVESWIWALKTGSSDAYMALLFSQAVRLKELSLALPSCAKYSNQIVHQAAGHGTGFKALQHLSKISFAWPEHTGQRGLYEVTPYLCLPSVEAYHATHAWRCTDPEVSWGWYTQKRNRLEGTPSLAPKLKTIDLRKTNLDPNAMKRLLSAYRSLESFELLVKLEPGQRYVVNTLGPLAFLQALQPSISTLRHLRLGAHSAMTSGRVLPLGSLQGFDHLTSLDIDVQILLGGDPQTAPSLADILPSSIESLVLRYWVATELWDDDDLISHLWALVPRAADQTRRLHTVHLVKAFGRHDLCGTFSTDELELSAAFSAAGIHLPSKLPDVKCI